MELPFMPLPPKEGKKKKKNKKKRRSKRREEKVSFPRYVSPKAVAYDSELDDEPMPITYLSDHDWEKHTTFNIENRFGLDYENDDMLTNENTLEDNYPIAYDDTMPPVFDNYYRDFYDLGYNYPYETCHSYGGITQNHPFNIQPVYHVEVIYDEPAPIVTNENFSYVESINSSMHHDKNVSGGGYIVDFINDATEIYYERGKDGYMHLNNIKFPLFMLKILKFHLFYLPMLATLCFMDLFFYKIILHRKWVRLKCA